MILSVIQVALAVIIVTLILLQERSSGISGLLGGDGGSFYQARRGMEKVIFYSTIVLIVAFLGVALYRLGGF
jgi:protein translocase SecG subunit